MRISRTVVTSSLVLIPILFLQAFEAPKQKQAKSQTAQSEEKPKVDLKKPIETKVDLAALKRQAAEGITSVKKNGVELAIALKTVPNKESTDIQVNWTIRYRGPRSPL